MSSPHSLRVLRQSLHLSYSQISTYLSCPLKYQYRYVLGQEPEHLSSSLLLGTAVHAALARFYTTLKETGAFDSEKPLLEFFGDVLTTDLAQAKAPVHFKAEAPDADALLSLGQGLLRAFLADPGFCGMEVVAIELPLKTRLCDPNGVPTEFDLVGAIDLLLKDSLGRLIAVDHKTAKAAYTQDAIDQDLQLSVYALLLQDNDYLAPGQNLLCAFNVLRKLKTPKIERHLSLRTPYDVRRFLQVSQMVLQAIDTRIYLPNAGWACADCPFQSACRKW